jgi:hypothetical protein
MSASCDGASCSSSACELYPPTPCESEIDLLEYYQEVATWLYIGNCTGFVGKVRGNYWRAMLCTCRGASEFYQDLVRQHPLRELVEMRYGAYLAGRAAREHYEKKTKM